jgi:ribulose-phosphate 3-epimerase
MKDIISASILSADFSRLGEQIAEVESAGVDWIHVDVIDGHFAPNITMGPFVVEACRRVTKLPLDVHLMIEKPERYLEDFANAGADLITVHIETCPHIHRTLDTIRQLGCRPGITLNPGTPAVAIHEVLSMVDMVLVLSVNPGFSGQAFIPFTLQKMREIRTLLDQVNPQAMIEVDGGITPQTLPSAKHAGANVFVVATAIFKNPNGIQAGVDALRASMRLD